MRLCKLCRQALERVLQDVGEVSLVEAAFLIRLNFPRSIAISEQISDFIETRWGIGQYPINEVLYGKLTPRNRW